MAPAPKAGAGWVHVRPSPPATRTRGTSPPAHPPQQHSQPAGAFLAPDHRPPLARVKLVRPRRRPAGRPRLRALQLDPDRAPARKPGSCEQSTTTGTTPPRRLEVTGLDQYALLTAGAPMGAAGVMRPTSGTIGHCA